MINWIKNKLGISDCESRTAQLEHDIDAIAWHIERTYGEGYVIDVKKKISAKLKTSQRYDQIERARKHRKKACV